MNTNSYGRGYGCHLRRAVSAAIRWGARRRVLPACMIVAVVTLCSPMLASVPAHATVMGASSCAFLPVASDVDILPAKEDVHAAYYVGSMPDSGNESFVVHGQFPHSVMLTWVVYDANAQIYSTLTDQQITPDPGSVNPFLQGASVLAPNRAYTLFLAQPGSPVPPGIPPGNVVSLPPPAGNSHFYVIMRSYWSQPGYSRFGGAVPTVQAVSAANPATPVACPPLDVTIPPLPPIQPPSPEPGKILFFRPPYDLIPAADGTSRATSDGCTDNYAFARVSPYEPNLIEVHKLPTFPDNQDYTTGSTWSDAFDVRYVDLEAYGESLLGTGSNVAMSNIKVQPDGSAIFLVMSPLGPADPFSQAALLAEAAANNWNVIQAGLDGAGWDSFVVYRNKLTTPGFAGAVTNMPCYGPHLGNWTNAPASYASSPANMGPYYLDGATCTVAAVLNGSCASQIG
jgi:hypothetical protein